MIILQIHNSHSTIKYKKKEPELKIEPTKQQTRRTNIVSVPRVDQTVPPSKVQPGQELRHKLQLIQ